jgi:hypothetical protein
MAMDHRRIEALTTKYATAFRVLAILLWLTVLPLALFWAYIKIHHQG